MAPRLRAAVLPVARLMFARYLLASIIALASDFALFLLLDRLGLPPVAAACGGYAGGLLVHWAISVRFVFDTGAGPSHGQRLAFIASALLGALGVGDLGSHFPSSDPALEGIASSELLTRVGEMMEKQGFAIGNLDTTLIAQEPRLGTQRVALRDSVASILGVQPSQVSVKITSSDRLGAIGRGEGIAAEAVVLLVPA